MTTSLRRGYPPTMCCNHCGHPFKIHDLHHRANEAYAESCRACSCRYFNAPKPRIESVGSMATGRNAARTRKVNMKKVAAGKSRCSCCGKVGAVPYSATDIKGLTFPFRPSCAPEGWTRVGS